MIFTSLLNNVVICVSSHCYGKWIAARVRLWCLRLWILQPAMHQKPSEFHCPPLARRSSWNALLQLARQRKNNRCTEERGTHLVLNQHVFSQKTMKKTILKEDFRQQGSRNCSRGLKCVPRPECLEHGPGDPQDRACWRRQKVRSEGLMGKVCPAMLQGGSRG